MSIGGIGSIGAGMHQMQMQTMRQAMFKQLDQNGDGSVTKGDLEAIAQSMSQTTGESIDADKVFSAVDTNQDGVIDQSEYNSAIQQFQNGHHHGRIHGHHRHAQGAQQGDDSADPLQALFQQMDQDGDGKISQSEFQAGLQNLTQNSGASADLSKVFALLDTNQDGVIDQSEQATATQTLAQASLANQPPPGPTPVQGSPDLLQALFQRLDKDGDGEVSLSEFQAGLQNLAQNSGTATDSNKMAAQAASAATGPENSSSALTQKLLRDFIALMQNDAYFQDSSSQSGIKAYA